MAFINWKTYFYLYHISLYLSRQPTGLGVVHVALSWKDCSFSVCEAGGRQKKITSSKVPIKAHNLDDLLSTARWLLSVSLWLWMAATMWPLPFVWKQAVYTTYVGQFMSVLHCWIPRKLAFGESGRHIYVGIFEARWINKNAQSFIEDQWTMSGIFNQISSNLFYLSWKKVKAILAAWKQEMIIPPSDDYYFNVHYRYQSLTSFFASSIMMIITIIIIHARQRKWKQ